MDFARRDCRTISLSYCAIPRSVVVCIFDARKSARNRDVPTRVVRIPELLERQEPGRPTTDALPDGSESHVLAETQGFEPWIQVLARMLP